MVTRTRAASTLLDGLPIDSGDYYPLPSLEQPMLIAIATAAASFWETSSTSTIRSPGAALMLTVAEMFPQ